MRMLNASVLTIILGIVSKAICIDLMCTSVSIKTCNVFDLEITSPDDKITLINGEKKSPYKYIGLAIEYETCHFVPRNVGRFFPQITRLKIIGSNLKWIEQGDLSEFTKLNTLNLEDNDLETLENGLFDYNTELKTVNLSNNKLRFIHKNIFDGLINLNSIKLEENICTKSIYNNDPDSDASDEDNVKDSNEDSNGTELREYFENYDPSSKRKVQLILKDYCQSWEDAPRISQNKFDEEVSDLQSKIDKLTHRLKVYDGNLDAALMNLRQQKQINSNENIDKTIEFDSPKINLGCIQDQLCIAFVFKIPFETYSIEGNYYKNQNITMLTVNQQQTLFLPQNFAEHFSTLRKLMITECDLCELNYNVLKGLDSLKVLNLTYNKISTIPADTFTDLKNLQILDLSFNRIRTLNDGVFENLKTLQKLYLNNNYLKSINAELLERMENLDRLFLQNNRLKFIGATLLTPLTSLKLANLSHNECIDVDYPTSALKDIETKIEDSCIAPVELNCKTIELESNENVGNRCQVEGLVVKYPKTRISKLSGVEGSNDSTIEIFIVEKQSMKFFPIQLSHELPNLTRIEILQSNLSSLQQMDFDGFTQLIEIVINGNNLSSFHRAFDTIPQLRLLNLSSNQIVSLPKNIFAKLTSLHTLILSNNRIVHFKATVLPANSMIETFRIDNNRLKFIETKTIRFLRKAKFIDLTGNTCIDVTYNKTKNSLRDLVELSGVIYINCKITS